MPERYKYVPITKAKNTFLEIIRQARAGKWGRYEEVFGR